MTGFQVDPAALGLTAEGVQGVLDELDQLGINGEQTSGSPVENLALSTDDAGNQVVSAILGEVLGRAHYVLRDLVGNAQQMVARLQSTQTRYQQVEHAITSKFTDLTDALMGAPSGGGAW